jgi:hypothetical protein
MFMSFFKKPTECLILGRDSITFLSSHSNTPTKLTYPETVVQFGDIHDSKKFAELTLDFFNTIHLKHKKVLMLLSDDIVYTKKVPVSEMKSFKTIAQAFENKVPLGSEKIIKSILTTNQGTILFITNKQMIMEILSLSESQKSIIRNILPLQALGVSKDQPLSDMVTLAYKTLRKNASIDFRKQV